jgi:hypothetical protein
MSADVYGNPFCNPVNEKWDHHGLNSISTWGESSAQTSQWDSIQ